MLETTQKKLNTLRDWLTNAGEAIDLVLDRVSHPGPHPQDLHRALDASALEGLRQVQRDSERILREIEEISEDLMDLRDTLEDTTR